IDYLQQRLAASQRFLLQAGLRLEALRVVVGGGCRGWGRGGGGGGGRRGWGGGARRRAGGRRVRLPRVLRAVVVRGPTWAQSRGARPTTAPGRRGTPGR